MHSCLGDACGHRTPTPDEGDDGREHGTAEGQGDGGNSDVGTHDPKRASNGGAQQMARLPRRFDDSQRHHRLLGRGGVEPVNRSPVLAPNTSGGTTTHLDCNFS